MSNNVLTGTEALALIIFYFGSVGVPILVYVIMQLGKLADLHKECRSIVSYLRTVKPVKDLERYCIYVSYDCDSVIYEKNRQARIAIIVTIFGGVYLAIGILPEPVEWLDASLYLFLSMLFPIAILWSVHTSIDNYTGTIGDMRGFIRAYYQDNNHGHKVNDEHSNLDAK